MTIVYNVNVENGGFKDYFMLDADSFKEASKKAHRIMRAEPLYTDYEIISIIKVGEVRGEPRPRKARSRRAQ